MSRMLDALRPRHREEPGLDKPPTPSQSATETHVLASLGYASHGAASAGMPPAVRTAVGVLLVAVAAGIVWQVAASNRLVSVGPWSLVFGPKQGAPRAIAAPRQVQPVVTQPKPSSVPAAPEAAGAAVVTPPKPSSAPASAAAAVTPPAPVAARTSEPAKRVVAPAPPAQTAQAAPLPSVNPGITWSPQGSPGAPNGTSGEANNFRLAVYYQRTGDFDKAFVHYRAVLDANELNAEAHNNLGLLYQDKGLYEEAIREFKRAIFIDAKYDKAHNNLGVALLRSGKMDAAVSEFRWIVAQDGRNVESLTNLALALRASGHLDEARVQLQRALAVNNRYANAHYNLGLVLEETGELSRAIDHYEQFLSMAEADTAQLAIEVRGRVQVLRAKILK